MYHWYLRQQTSHSNLCSFPFWPWVNGWFLHHAHLENYRIQLCVHWDKKIPSSWSEFGRRVPCGRWRYAIVARTMTMGCYRMSVLHLANTCGERCFDCRDVGRKVVVTTMKAMSREMLELWALVFEVMMGAVNLWIYGSNHRTKLGEPASIPS